MVLLRFKRRLLHKSHCVLKDIILPKKSGKIFGHLANHGGIYTELYISQNV